MKATIKIKELPVILQHLLIREQSVLSNDLYAKPYLDAIDWTKATDAERLDYCEVRYPKGTKLKSTVGTEGICNGLYEVWDNNVLCGDIELPHTTGYFCLYEHREGKFAEIIEDEVKEPSIKEKLKGTCVLNESVEMGAEIVKLYTEAGFENPYKRLGKNRGVYYGILEDETIDWCSDYVYSFRQVLTLDQLRSIVRGDKVTEKDWVEFARDQNTPINLKPTESVEFKEGEISICEIVNAQSVIDCDRFFYMGFLFGKHWGMVNTTDKTMYELSCIRKIDPDKELKDIAKPILKKWDLLTDGKCDPNVLSAMIEAMKRVKK